MKIEKSEMIRHGLFLIAVCVAALMVYSPLNDLFHSSYYENYHDLIPFIPIISAYLLYLKRDEVKEKKRYAFGQGLPIIAAGFAIYLAASCLDSGLNENDYATLIVFAALVVVWGAFMGVYGRPAFSTCIFSLAFLIFTMPFPMAVMSGLIGFLQRGSTECANFLLWISGIPYVRDGFVFQFPGFSAEVAPQCSGIRSGLALFITALLAGHLFLKTWWKQLILLLCVVPMTMLKNGIRIATLSLLSYYVNPRILASPLHREGGIPFFIIALLLMAPILFFLRRSERKDVTSDKDKEGQQ